MKDYIFNVEYSIKVKANSRQEAESLLDESFLTTPDNVEDYDRDVLFVGAEDERGYLIDEKEESNDLDG